MCNHGNHEISYQRRFPYIIFSFSYHKITLFDKKYDIKLITFISMYHLKPPEPEQVHEKLKYTQIQ